MTSHQKQAFEEWLKQKDEVPLVSPRPCFDSDWMTDRDEFEQQHPGQLHMHSTMLKLLNIFNLAGLGNRPSKLQWRTLFEIKFANIITEDGSDPDAVIDGLDYEQRLVRAICELFGQNPKATDQRTRTLVPSPSDLGFIRQFAINLACSSTHPTKKQLLSYTKSLGKKSNLHRAYDAARELLGKIKINSIGPDRPIQHRSKRAKDDSPLKIADEKSDDDNEASEIHGGMTNNLPKDPDYSERSTTSEDEELVIHDDYGKKMPAKTIPKKVFNTDVAAILPTETGDHPTPETITIPEIVEAMIQSVDEKNFIESLQDVGTQIQVKKGNKKVLVTTFRELTTFSGQLQKAGWEPIKQKGKCLPNFLSKLNISRKVMNQHCSIYHFAYSS
jgi:hypothetical protein